MHIEIDTQQMSALDRMALIALLRAYDDPGAVTIPFLPTETVKKIQSDCGITATPETDERGPQGAQGTAGQPGQAGVALVAPAGVTLDKNGLPHDARIHASTAVLNSDGSWRAKRNVDPALVAQVEAELRAVMSAPPPTNAVVPPPPPAAADVPPPPPAAADVPPPPPAAADVPPPPPAAADVPPPPPAEAATVSPFAAVMKRVVALQGAGTITTDDVTGYCVGLGLTSIRDLAKRPDLIPSFEALLP